MKEYWKGKGNDWAERSNNRLNERKENEEAKKTNEESGGGGIY